MRFFLLIVIVPAAVFGLLAYSMRPAELRPPYQTAVVTPYQAVVDEINLERADYGLKPLQASQSLSDSSYKKASYLYVHQQFTHTPDGQPFDHYISKDFRSRGEVLARNVPLDGLVPAWLGSPEHRDALLNPDYRWVGVSVSGNIAVAHFGR